MLIISKHFIQGIPYKSSHIRFPEAVKEADMASGCYIVVLNPSNAEANPECFSAERYASREILSPIDA